MRLSISRRTQALAIVVMLPIALLSVDRGARAGANYPEKPIRIVTVTSPGGPGAMAARIIGEQLTAQWGKPVVVESMVGAGGSLAAAHVAKSPPDGYTLLMSGDAAIVTNVSLYKKLQYDPVKDLAPISQIAFTPNILAVSNDLPAKSVQELVGLARSQPGKLTFAYGGLGFSQHLAGEVFKSMAKIDIQRVSYRGGAEIMPDLISGRVSLCFCNITAVLPLAREGRLRALAITSLKRSQAAPDLPTMDESGFSGFDVNAWFGLMAPAGTPKPIIEMLHRETARILALPEVREKFRKLAMEIIGNSPDEFAAIIKAEIPQRKKVIESAGIVLQ
jgi:tripartite-type tricarboxylate transporter receptor subunit TctC